MLNEVRRGHAEYSMGPLSTPSHLIGQRAVWAYALFSFFMKQVLIDKSIKSKIHAKGKPRAAELIMIFNIRPCIYMENQQIHT